jgi:Sulfotransferase family
MLAGPPRRRPVTGVATAPCPAAAETIGGRRTRRLSYTRSVKKRLHIVGCSPRSGTTLLAEMCRVCFEVDGACEHEQSVFKRITTPFDIFLTKRPRDTLFMPSLLPLDPGLWCIFTMRDPRDVITSEHKRLPGQYYASLRMWQDNFGIWQRVRNHPRFITVRYEDLVRDPDGVQAELLRRMPFLRARHKFSEYHRVGEFSEASQRAMHTVRPVDTASVARWQSHLPRIKGQCQMHGDLEQPLIEAGYEQDGAWKAMLDGVEPDLRPSADGEPVIDGRERLKLRWKVVRRAPLYLLRRYLQ